MGTIQLDMGCMVDMATPMATDTVTNMVTNMVTNTDTHTALHQSESILETTTAQEATTVALVSAVQINRTMETTRRVNAAEDPMTQKRITRNPLMVNRPHKDVLLPTTIKQIPACLDFSVIKAFSFLVRKLQLMFYCRSILLLRYALPRPAEVLRWSLGQARNVPTTCPLWLITESLVLYYHPLIYSAAFAWLVTHLRTSWPLFAENPCLIIYFFSDTQISLRLEHFVSFLPNSVLSRFFLRGTR